jgi:hypothetical protein
MCTSTPELRLVEDIVTKTWEANELRNEYIETAREAEDLGKKQDYNARADDRMAAVRKGFHDLYHRAAKVPEKSTWADSEGRDAACRAAGDHQCTVLQRAGLEYKVYTLSQELSREEFTNEFLTNGRAHELFKELHALQLPKASCKCY